MQNNKTFPQKGADQQIWSALSIDSSCSKATSHKSDTPVSGGAHQDARKVSLEWNARLKHWLLPEFRGRKHQIVTKRPFSPPSFPARRKRRCRRRQLAAANLQQPLSQPAADSSPGRGAKGCASPEVLRIGRQPLFLSKIYNSLAGKRLFFLHYCFFTLAHQYGKLLAR